MYMRGLIAVAATAAMLAGTLGCGSESDVAELLDGVVAGASAEGQQRPDRAGQQDRQRPGEDRTQLTEEQRAEVEALREDLANGVISDEEFRVAMEELVDPLDLTEEQKEAARAIRESAREDIEALHEAARADFVALLTDEQAVLLEQWEADHPRSGPGRPGGPPEEAGHMPRHFAERAEHLGLGLTDEPLELAEAIRADLRTAVEARHEEARDAFEALLTDEQLAVFAELPPPPRADRTRR